MAGTKFVHGADVVEKFLRGLPEKVAKNVTTQSLRAGANVIVRASRRKLRSNGDVDSGTLSKKIGTRTVKRSDKGSAEVFVTIKGGSATVVRKGKTKPTKATPRRYAHLIEFGREGVPAHSFMRAAVDSDGTQAVAKIIDTAGKALQRETAKLASGKTSFVTGRKIG